VEGFAIISSPSGWFGDWHPAPRKQYMFCLSGELEVEVSDGEIRRFNPGSVILLEDTSGKGHVSRVVGEGRGYMAAMPVKDKN
jgi:quercetin dioxygenase-like cupin family protein